MPAQAAQLQQLLWNLLGNAQQACEGGGKISLEIDKPTDLPQGAGKGDRSVPRGGAQFVELAVSDDGVGIDPASLERIFDPFFTTRIGGTGLGLATVHRIVESHGGTIQVESSLGHGTCFRLLLPVEGLA